MTWDQLPRCEGSTLEKSGRQLLPQSPQREPTYQQHDFSPILRPILYQGMWLQALLDAYSDMLKLYHKYNDKLKTLCYYNDNQER